MINFTEKQQDLFDKMCRAADVYMDGLITGDEFRSFVVDFTDEMKLSLIEPPHDENHYRFHTPAGPNPPCPNCQYEGFQQ